MAALQTALLDNPPLVPGLDPSIVVHPRRLHLTLGVMALSPEPPATDGDPLTGVAGKKTLSQALDLLNKLKPEIMDILRGEGLYVPLNQMSIMKPEHRDTSQAHVLWIGPSSVGSHAGRLRQVCGMYPTTIAPTLV